VPDWVEMTPKTKTERIVELLADANLFGTLAADDLASCAADFRETRFAKGQLLFARGDPGSHIYLVSEGQIRLAIASGDGRELSFEIAAPGDLFGEIAVLDGLPRSAGATALAPTVAYTIERRNFRRLMAQHQALADAVVTFLCGRLREVSNKLETVALYTLDVRLARFLLSAIGNRQAPPGQRVPLDLHYSQSELALLLGASRPKINAALSALESVGAIRRTSDRLFCDRAKLAQIAQRHDA
jgi:CRP/FNR family cyclic AMP-dependent transcriptional regulator